MDHGREVRLPCKHKVLPRTPKEGRGGGGSAVPLPHPLVRCDLGGNGNKGRWRGGGLIREGVTRVRESFALIGAIPFFLLELVQVSSIFLSPKFLHIQT